MIGLVRGVLLEVAEAAYLADALDALLRDRRPSAKLQDVLDRLRRTVANASVSDQNTGVDARIVGQQADSVDHAAYDLVDTAEAAAILGITPNGVRDLARRGRLRRLRAGGRWLYPARSVVARAEQRSAKRG